MFHLLSPEEISELEEINKSSQSKVIVCDHGDGPGIDDDFLEMDGFEAQKVWFNQGGAEPLHSSSASSESSVFQTFINFFKKIF